MFHFTEICHHADDGGINADTVATIGRSFKLSNAIGTLVFMWTHPAGMLEAGSLHLCAVTEPPDDSPDAIHPMILSKLLFAIAIQKYKTSRYKFEKHARLCIENYEIWLKTVKPKYRYLYTTCWVQNDNFLKSFPQTDM